MCEEAEMDRFQVRAQGKHGVFSSGLVIGMLLAFFFAGPVGCYEMRAEKQRAIAQGKVLFEAHCCGCHNGKRSDLVKTPPDLSGIFQKPFLPSGAPATDASVRSAILGGRAGIMPSFRDALNDKQIGKILRYLHTVGPKISPCAR
jgi:mono/diheme cytochrome c family protein